MCGDDKERNSKTIHGVLILAILEVLREVVETVMEAVVMIVVVVMVMFMVIVVMIRKERAKQFTVL